VTILLVPCFTQPVLNDIMQSIYENKIGKAPYYVGNVSTTYSKQVLLGRKCKLLQIKEICNTMCIVASTASTTCNLSFNHNRFVLRKMATVM
jgi:hypothetical protein